MRILLLTGGIKELTATNLSLAATSSALSIVGTTALGGSIMPLLFSSWIYKNRNYSFMHALAFGIGVGLLALAYKKTEVGPMQKLNYSIFASPLLSIPSSFIMSLLGFLVEKLAISERMIHTYVSEEEQFIIENLLLKEMDDRMLPMMGYVNYTFVFLGTLIALGITSSAKMVNTLLDKIVITPNDIAKIVTYAQQIEKRIYQIEFSETPDFSNRCQITSYAKFKRRHN